VLNEKEYHLFLESGQLMEPDVTVVPNLIPSMRLDYRGELSQQQQQGRDEDEDASMVQAELIRRQR
jgi:hypothetical protein